MTARHWAAGDIPYDPALASGAALCYDAINMIA